MVNLYPEYDENIIVGVLYDGVFNWYVTDKEIWFLDYKKRIDAFREKGFDIKEEYIDDSRKNLLILNSNNAKVFLERIESLKVNSEELKELLQNAKISDDDTWVYDFRPSLFIDFDSQKLFSLYGEPASYEEYTPINWNGYYYDFREFIPNIHRYWIGENEKDLLE